MHRTVAIGPSSRRARPVARTLIPTGIGAIAMTVLSGSAREDSRRSVIGGSAVAARPEVG